MGVDRDSTASSARSGDVVFDRYRVENKIADGGMSTVYRCRDLQTGNDVALKLLHEVYNDKEVVRTRFIDEGRIQQMLSHPNIVDVYDVEESEELLGIVMELVEGQTLEDYLEERGPLPTKMILELMLPVLSAIGFAHSKGVIHRDIKPSNVLLKPTPKGIVPRVMDFGVAKLVRGKDLTATGTTVGTLHYMSPEQIVGSKDIDGRADIYSLGCTVYKLCTGDVPFNASTEFALMMAQVEAPPTPPSELEPDIAAQLEAVIMRCLEKRPDERFPSVRDLTIAMLDLRSDSGGDTTESVSISQDLLDYAMNADEVAVDRTGVIDIAALAEASEDASPTMQEMRRVEIDDDEVAATREMRFDPSIDKKDYLGSDPTIEASLDDMSTSPLSPISQNGERSAKLNDTAEETRPMRAVDASHAGRKDTKKTQKIESTTTTEFKPDERVVEGNPSVDSKEQTKPRARVDGSDDTASPDLSGQTTEEQAAPKRDTERSVKVMKKPDFDGDAVESEADDNGSTATIVVQIALVIVLFALIGVIAAILLGYL